MTGKSGKSVEMAGEEEEDDESEDACRAEEGFLRARTMNVHLVCQEIDAFGLGKEDWEYRRRA